MESGRDRVCASGLNPLAPIFVPNAYSLASVGANPTSKGLQVEGDGFGQLPDEVHYRVTPFWTLCQVVRL